MKALENTLCPAQSAGTQKPPITLQGGEKKTGVIYGQSAKIGNFTAIKYNGYVWCIGELGL